MNDLSKLTRQPYEKNEAGPAWSPKSLKSWILCRLDRSTLRSLLAWTNFTSWLAATEQLAQIAGIERGTTILDAGSGLGGPSRYLVSTYGCRVIGADLSPSFAAVAQVLAQRTGLDALVIYQVADLAKKRVALEDADSDCLFPNLLRRADFRSTDEVDLNWLQHNGVLNLPSRSSYCCNQKIV